MSLDPQLVEILACPDTHHTPLDYDPAAQTLTCPRCRRVFEVRDGIPILLLDEARRDDAGQDEARQDDAGQDDAGQDDARQDDAGRDGDATAEREGV